MPLLFLACSDELTPVIQPSSPFPSKVFRMKYNTLQICGEGTDMISHIQNDSSILTNMMFDRAVRRMTATSRRNPYTIFLSFFSECWALEAGGDSLIFLNIHFTSWFCPYDCLSSLLFEPVASYWIPFLVGSLNHQTASAVRSWGLQYLWIVSNTGTLWWDVKEPGENLEFALLPHCLRDYFTVAVPSGMAGDYFQQTLTCSRNNGLPTLLFSK